MNKISKKIVALVTMAAFVLTLVPMAAFAAVASSTVAVDSDTQEITLQNGSVNATVTVKLSASDQQLNVSKNVFVWVTKNGTLYRDASFDPAANGGKTGNLKYAANLANDKFVDGTATVQITLPEAGEYKVYAGIANGKDEAQNTSDLLPITAVSGADTITVKDADSYVSGITITGADPTAATYGTITYSNPDGVNLQAVSGTVDATYSETGKTGASSVGKEVTISNPYVDQGLVVVNDKNKEITKVPVENGNKINFNILATSDLPAGEYTLTLSVDNVNYKLTVKVTKDADTTAKTIEAVDTGKTLIAATSTANTSLGDVARFVIKNAAGEALDAVKGQGAQSGSNILVLAAPDNSTAMFKLGDYDQKTKAYPLVLTSGSLIPGEYKVRVALDSKDSADVTFTVERFGKIVDSKIVITDDADASKTPVTNVYGDHIYTATVKVVDENGLEKTATNIGGMVAGINSGNDALNGGITTNNLATDGTFTFTVTDDKSNNDNALIGTVIKFTAFSINDGIDASAEVTVADPANTEGVSLAFDSEAGEAAKYNTVNVTVVNADGDKVDVDSAAGKVYATVVDQSNEDANISAKMGAVTAGKGELTLYSDKETTADIRVTVIDGDNIIYANTLSYAFGEQDIPVNTSVVMTIGSNDFVVNNDVVTVKDAAPYIANDRTYVPFRALGEALGAKVEWDQDAQTVTYTTDKTILVMTIGKTTYTVNGEEKTMDVAPELKNDRTYVPVRFVGEAFGFKVTALYAADGTTASVLFQK